ncbi:MAG: chromosome segregation protein SMC [Deltaproteobacteria bacterium]|nr:chromosome segregation protein SMC [Deltaproteobacteria bacterium]
MKIKKLTIHGFKSFVDKVTLNFPLGTSGIIGPNGCGKSNIVDAIRWVLGEQNARHLRGKHMEDIIFNGSESRKPLGMAEVVLTFSNEGGAAAGGRFSSFTEIEISRRLYRSGESEYYINRVQSRLRDIVDLFTDTGIATRAYSIIEQGQVGWLISAKPEERRAIFEEAAGINKFKHKKEAALRRLEATRENLTRVSDIISEVKRQLNSLNRQAKKAERYKALREELRGVDILLSSLELKKLQDELDGALKRLESIKDEEISLSASIASKENLMDELKTGYESVEAVYRNIRERVFGVEKLIQDEERKSALSKMRIEELNRDRERLAKEIDELRSASERAGIELASLGEALEAASSAIASESARRAETSASFDAVASQLKEKEDAQRAVKAEALKTSTRLNDLRHAAQNLLRDEDNLRVRSARASSEKEEALRLISSLETPLKALQDTLAGKAVDKEAKEGELKSIRERLDSLDADRTKKLSEAKARKDESSKAAARLATLEEMERNFEGLKGGPKAIMKKGALSGIRGLLADVIETNPGFEKAVEAVLGDRLQFIIVESQKEGIDAIEFLKSTSSGRGSFVPVQNLRSSSPVPAQGNADLNGVRELISEVRIKDGYESVAGYLLGDTLVADSLQAALELWNQNDLYRAIVTLDGDVIDAQGVITGGSSLSTDGILQKRGEIKSLRQATARLSADSASCEAALKNIETEISSTKTLLDECRERIHAIDIERVTAENELKRSNAEYARLSKVRDTAEADILDAETKGRDIASKKTSINSEREAAEQALIEKERAIAALSEEIHSLASEKDRLSGILTEIRVNLAHSNERFESIKREIASKESAVSDTSRKIETRSSQIERGSVEAEEKLKSLEELKIRLEGLLAELDAAKNEEVQRTEEMNNLANRLKDAEHEIKGLKSAYSELQELKGELSIDSKEFELSIANLRDKVSEKYSVALVPYVTPEDGHIPDTSSEESRRAELREKISELGEVSLSALEEYAELERRHQFLLDQQADLTKSVDALHTAITRINRTTREKFKTAFDEINAKFQETFPRFFSGGRAELRLTEDSDILEAGVDIVAQPPGKRLQSISLLSGGEKALTATALIFSIFLIKPSPFCLLDEVDAPLDDANIDRFNIFVKEMARISQFMLITHNKKTMEMADALYGITMEEPGVSKVISVRF